MVHFRKSDVIVAGDVYINTTFPIVQVDQGGSFQATRLLYSLYRDGFPAKDLLVLDGVRRWEDLPRNARSYVERMAQLSGVKVIAVSVGAERGETIIVENPFLVPRPGRS